MAALGFIVCVTAAYRLSAAPAPLSATAAGVAVANLLCMGTSVLASRGERRPPRALTGCQHVTTALGAFFLFVSFALP